jgi:hypothetical protein
MYFGSSVSRTHTHQFRLNQFNASTQTLPLDSSPHQRMRKVPIEFSAAPARTMEQINLDPGGSAPHASCGVGRTARYFLGL